MQPEERGIDYMDPAWQWSSWKFDLPPEALFTTLYKEYNLLPVPIHDAIAFHHDVSEIADTATTIPEFHALLKERRLQRLGELRECWDAVSLRIAHRPFLLDEEKDEATNADRWSAFLHFSREFSVDAITRYFSLFTHAPVPSHVASNVASSPPSPSQSETRNDCTSASKIGTALTQSRKRASSTSVDEDGPEPLHPAKRVCGENKVSNGVEQRPSCDAKPTPSTATPSTSTLRRSSRIKANGQNACSGRSPDPVHSGKTSATQRKPRRKRPKRH